MGTTSYGGKGSKGRAANADRLVGAANCRKEQHTMASCQTPPTHPPWELLFVKMGFETCNNCWSVCIASVCKYVV